MEIYLKQTKSVSLVSIKPNMNTHNVKSSSFKLSALHSMARLKSIIFNFMRLYFIWNLFVIKRICFTIYCSEFWIENAWFGGHSRYRRRSLLYTCKRINGLFLGDIQKALTFSLAMNNKINGCCFLNAFRKKPTNTNRIKYDGNTTFEFFIHAC